MKWVAVHLIQTARTCIKREKDADSDWIAIVFSNEERRKDFYFSHSGCKEKKADYTETTQKEYAARKKKTSTQPFGQKVNVTISQNLLKL